MKIDILSSIEISKTIGKINLELKLSCKLNTISI